MSDPKPTTSPSPSSARGAPVRVEHRFVLPISVAQAFEVFSDPRRLDSLTPSWFGLDIVEPLPPNLGVGVSIDYRLRWRMLKLHWRSAITQWQPPHLLTYEQARGPYRFFSHLHVFESTAEGTEITDCIDFRLPSGPLLEPLVARELERILKHRAAVSATLSAVSASRRPGHQPAHSSRTCSQGLWT